MSHVVQIAMVEIWKIANSLAKDIPKLKENVFKHAGELMTSVWIFMGAAPLLLLLPSLSTDFIGTALFVAVFFTQKLIWKEEWNGLLGLQLSRKDLVNAFQGR